MKLPKITSEAQLKEYKDLRANLATLNPRTDCDGRIKSLNKRILEWLDRPAQTTTEPVVSAPVAKPVKTIEQIKADAHEFALKQHQESLQKRLGQLNK